MIRGDVDRLIDRSGTTAMDASQEETLRALDRRDALAVLERDAVVAAGIYDEDFLLHFAPAKVVRKRAQVLHDMQTRPPYYLAFERETEFVSVQGDLAVTVGNETATATADHRGHAAGAVHRRFSHVWRLRGTAWRLLFRRVNIA